MIQAWDGIGIGVGNVAQEGGGNPGKKGGGEEYEKQEKRGRLAGVTGAERGEKGRNYFRARSAKGRGRALANNYALSL